MADIAPPTEVGVPPRPSLARRTSAYFNRLSKRYHFRHFFWAGVTFVVVVIFLSLVPTLLNPTPPTRVEKKRDKDWIDSSPYWADRQACRWLSLCGFHHLRWDDPVTPRRNSSRGHSGGGGELRRGVEMRALAAEAEDYSDYTWLSRESLGEESWEIAVPESTSDAPDDAEAAASSASANAKREHAAPPVHRDIPSYVLDYAPLVHLYSGENFWPSNIAEHIKHMVPFTEGEALEESDDDDEPLDLNNLYRKLNNISTPLYLTSEVDVETRPEWLHSHEGVPLPFANGTINHGNDGTNSGGNTDAKNGHDYEQPPQDFNDDTTWPSVDRDHPLNRISDPRKLPNPMWGAGLPELKTRATGPQDVRTRNLRRAALHQIVMNGGADSEGVTADGESFSVHGYKPDKSGYSKAPAILVLVDKGSGILDAFWFFFYSYNLGQTVLKVRYGNHVGDWEHSMTRFENGVPRALFLSEHAGGQAYAWSALEKMNATSPTGRVVERPVIYSAVGSHAMYALPGTHPYVLPFKMLRDETDRGPLWDPAKNNLAYFYDYKHDKDGGGPVEDAHIVSSDSEGDGLVGRKRPGKIPPTSLVAASKNADAPTAWFHFRSPWGDETYELGDPRQWRLFGQYHYITGPQGPKFKNLGRSKVCQTRRCRILYSLDAGKKASWYS